MGAVPVSIGSLAGVRELASMRRDELVAMGEETADLARVVDLGVPFGAIWVIGLSDDAEGKTLAAVTAALALDLTRPVVELGAFFRTHALAARCRKLWPATIALRRGDDVRARVHELFRVLESREMLVAIGGVTVAGARTEVGVRVTVRDEGASGVAASVDPRTGDPDVVAVWSESGTPALLDRKTMRPLSDAPSDLRPDVVERAADLADRAQLALGRPVELAFGHLRGRLVVLGVRPLALAPCFTDAPYRRVALLTADEGPIAPLAIDALDRALRRADDDAPRVLRIYARAYRRVEARIPGSPPVEGASALTRAAQIASDLTRPVAAVRAFEESLEARLDEIDRASADARTGAEMLVALRDHQRVVVEALSLLESARVATLTAVSVLEATCGTLPREAVHALAALRRTRARRRVDERLLRLARHLVDQIGEIPEAHRVPAALRRRWDEVKLELRDVRPIGVDVRPLPYGASDAALRAALIDALRTVTDAEETARREAVRRLLATARGRPLGRMREGIAGTLSMGLAQLADIKGRMGEALAIALLRLRGSASNVGAHLVDHGMLDDPDDALYLGLGEIEEAIGGEPGAYASRVRLRREADLRWRALEAPRRLAARA
ncbi:Hypothetical protein I5071_24390 [Sandaracinus amylolyticus]|nr:Hypothetical protein I5071_24390 [Sandaracinus amylolyticus]